MDGIPKYEVEIFRRIIDNLRGSSITIRPDCDGLGLIEIDGKDEYGRIVFPPDMLPAFKQVIDALFEERFPK